jgi:hypothetical protein
MMTRSASLLLLALPTACSAASADDFRKGVLPTARYDVPQAVFADLLARFPEGVEGRQELELNVNENDDGSNVVLLTVTGLLDDAIGAEQHRAVLRFDKSGWRVTQIGERWKCRRGPGGGWTTKRCN